MAIVKWNSAIDYVKGALTKPKKDKTGHKCGDYLIGTHREAATTNPNCTRAYVRGADGYQRSTPITADEVAQRNRFAAVARAVVERSQDLTRMSADIAAFKAQKDSPNGKKTMRAYLWMLELAVYDQSH